MGSDSSFGMGGSSMDDDGDSSQGTDRHSVFTWVLIPLCILVAFAIILSVIRYKRRKSQRNMRGIAMLQQDVEAMGPNRVRRAPDGRWQWVVRDPRYGSQRMDVLGSRTEGLNEFGEAPPAYTPPQKRPDEVELHAVVTSPLAPQAQDQDQDQNPNSLQLPSHPEATATTRMPQPPAYVGAGDGRDPAASAEPIGNQQSNPQNLSVPTPPAPAHVPST